MRKQKGLILLIFVVATLQSCDPYSHGYICNDTTDEIELELKFKYDSLDQWTKTEFLSSFKEQIDSNAFQIRIDTASMIGYYKLKSKTCALVGHGMSVYPLLDFSNLQVRTKNKTLTFPNIDENVTKFFKEEEEFKLGFGGDYYLKIEQE